MFKELRVQNFQSHKDSVLQFSPNVTAICGLNNMGKSAFVKAIKKVVRDDPDGTTFIRDGEKECLISIEVDNTTILRRVRNDKSDEANMYVVGSTEFTKFARTGIPIEVKNALNISGIQTFTDIDIDLNFQTQLDELFLIQGDGLASKRGKILGRTTGIDVVAKAIQIAASEERSNTIERNRNSEELNKTEGELLQYETIDAIVESSKQIEKGLTAFQESQSQLESLKIIYRSLLDSISKARVVTERLKILKVDFLPTLERLKTLQGIKKKTEEILRLKKQIEELASFVEGTKYELTSSRERLKVIQTKIFNLSKFREISNLKNQIASLITKIVEVPRIEPLWDLYNRYEKLDDLQDDIQKYYGLIDMTKAGLKSLGSQKEEASIELNNLKETLGVCPVCQKPF